MAGTRRADRARARRYDLFVGSAVRRAGAAGSFARTGSGASPGFASVRRPSLGMPAIFAPSPVPASGAANRDYVQATPPARPEPEPFGPGTQTNGPAALVRWAAWPPERFPAA